MAMATTKPGNVLLQVRVDPKLHAALSERAAQDSRTVASLVRKLLLAALRGKRAR
jgi:hypothetical protein